MTRSLFAGLIIAAAAAGCDDGAAEPTPADATADAQTLDAGAGDGAPDADPADAMGPRVVDGALRIDLGIADQGAPDAAPDAMVDPGYADRARWLCHPEHDTDPCRTDLDATAYAADGTATPRPHAFAEDPPVDCFYVYPTTSIDPGSNSDLSPGAEERFIAHEQAGRFTSVCRIFAPVYRQVTVTGLLGDDPQRWALAYGDVADAWAAYRAEHPERPVILIGHSQGASHLRELIRAEIDGDAAARAQLVAAYLIGSSVTVPPDAAVGGSFQNIPLCTAADQPGCVVSYATYRASDPPGDDALFGGRGRGDLRSACVNPAALVGDPDALDSIFPRAISGFYASLIDGMPSPWADPEAHPPVPTPHFSVPGLIAGRCVAQGAHDYLSITLHGDPMDPRVDDVVGDFAPGWGLHLIDMHLVAGDLERLARQQIAAYLAR